MTQRNRRTPGSGGHASPAGSRRPWRVALVAAGAAACLTASLGTASAAPGRADARPAAAARTTLRFTEQTQTQNQWCWAATGLSIAQYLGRGTNISQNTFCDLARGLPTSSFCPNQPGQLQDVQRAWSQLGMSPGSVTGVLPFSTVASAIDAGSPVEVGIYWTAGGGHANVLYGYDSTRSTLSFSDPWPSNPRYGEMTYNSYVRNSSFNWGQSLYGER
ncbi:papain-like cysteine protease family protein [Streptomyces sp. NPDC047017]|uniref:papain-like cysteine protease family protein n=1 Tax=Streptomyces sp. NPDC047017 TaxID=3155024 RepID=UPI0033FED86E